MSIVKGEPRLFSDDKINKLVAERQWLVVETGIRQYVSRLYDNREQSRDGDDSDPAADE